VAQATVAVVTEHAAYFPRCVVMINNKLSGIAANNTLCYFCFDLLKLFIAYRSSELTTTYFIAVCGAALPAPTIKAVELFVMWREKLC
jgi:hypothetical protein